jgi:hypothetical protein
MTNAEWDKARAEITGMKAVLYSLCAVQPLEQARFFKYSFSDNLIPFRKISLLHPTRVNLWGGLLQ